MTKETGPRSSRMSRNATYPAPLPCHAYASLNCPSFEQCTKGLSFLGCCNYDVILAYVFRAVTFGPDRDEEVVPL